MKPLNTKELSLKKAILIFLAFVLVSLLFGCSQKVMQPQYKVLSVEKIKGNAYILKTDSFVVIRIVRGAGKYNPRSISKKGYLQ